MGGHSSQRGASPPRLRVFCYFLSPRGGDTGGTHRFRGESAAVGGWGGGQSARFALSPWRLVSTYSDEVVEQHFGVPTTTRNWNSIKRSARFYGNNASPNMKLRYFKSAAAFRRWLEANHARASKLWLGFYKKDSGEVGISYAEALDEALCFGWIDGLKQRVDELRFAQRFTPRKPTSNWSLINIRHGERLKKAGRMTPAGLSAFAARTASKSGVYSFENKPRELSPALKREFKSDQAAWDFFQQQPPGYRRVASFWVMSAKQTETRQRRLAQLLSDSKQGRRLGMVGGKR